MKNNSLFYALFFGLIYLSTLSTRDESGLADANSWGTGGPAEAASSWDGLLDGLAAGLGCPLRARICLAVHSLQCIAHLYTTS